MSGPVIAAGSPPARSSRSRASSDVPTAASRVSRTSAEPDAVLLEAAAVAAAAEPAVRHQAQVPDLAADAVPAAEQLPAGDHATADARADGDHQLVVDVATGAVAELAPGRGVRVVLDRDRQPGQPEQLRAQGLVAPGDVGSEQHGGAVGVDVAGRADAHRGDRVLLGEPRDEGRDRRLDRLGIGRRGLDPRLLQDRAVEVDDRTGDLGAADVDAAGDVPVVGVIVTRRRRRGRCARRPGPGAARPGRAAARSRGPRPRPAATTSRP